MPDIIHFRSHQRWRQTGLGSTRNMKQRGSEYDSLRLATPLDDARDIAWKQSLKWESLYMKSREESTDIIVSLIGIEDQSWDFSLEGENTKRDFYTHLERACHHTSIREWYSYTHHIYTHTSIYEISWELIDKHVRNKLMICIVSDLEKSHYEYLGKLAIHNDIIILHLLHPYESDTNLSTSTLIESSLIDIWYISMLRQARENIRSYLIGDHISYLPALSTDDPTTLLNHFFKYRYARC